MRINSISADIPRPEPGIASSRPRREASTSRHISDSAVRPLDTPAFASLVDTAPLIAIDLIVRDGAGNALFGLRRNPPACGYWFVPGGRIYKNERLDDAFHRISLDELGINLSRNQSQMVGVYEHFYDTNFLGHPGKSTHYVVLCHAVIVAPRLVNLPRRQHSDYAWLRETDVGSHPDVHPYAKSYFPIE